MLSSIPAAVYYRLPMSIVSGNIGSLITRTLNWSVHSISILKSTMYMCVHACPLLDLL